MLITASGTNLNAPRRATPHEEGVLPTPWPPILTLPNEITAEIFECCLPSDRFITPDSMDAPLLIAQVCGHWRRIALSTPRLWSRICIDDDDPIIHDEIPFTKSTLPLMRTWLSRSSNCPLKIAFSNTGRKTNPSLVKAILLEIWDYRDRWEEITLAAPCRRLHHISWSSSGTRGFPLLKVFSIQSLSRMANTSPPFPVIQIKPAPLLTAFIAHSPIPPPPFCAPWAQLKSIKIRSFGSMSECYDVLRQCAKLSSCEVAIRSQSDDGRSEFAPIVLPNLTELDIHANAHLDLLLDSLTVPRLTKLRIWALAPSVRAPILNLITRSRCLIQSLLLSAPALSDLELIQILRNSPHLLDLLLDHSDTFFTDVAVRALTWHGHLGTEDQQHPYLVPRLHSLIISGTTGFTSGVFIDMMKSRWSARTAGVLNLVSKEGISDADVLNSEGIDVLAMPSLDYGLRLTICNGLAVCRDEGLYLDDEFF
ncbi:hypothetical protein JAAARDRAFT_53071 [Jaapia argillacea MUCL 33604]|uniref:F-box domain-containing protein n=1 Tax=Jaapia argillacea MUCL 33604 TaxID=933084 RepID=A0A067QNN4_9AGAM|nr:hypothetical protein JAAARDRAFT_53071 [Jaapia argillacea MUCL 33604]